MILLESYAPEHLTQAAERSGFFQCKKCGLVWFGRTDIAQCPEGPHGKPVHVAILCRTCDVAVPIERFAEHLAGQTHLAGVA